MLNPEIKKKKKKKKVSHFPINSHYSGLTRKLILTVFVTEGADVACSDWLDSSDDVSGFNSTLSAFSSATVSSCLSVGLS